MEVADQWRREWAGTAEYGKVTEGGVTRRIARAMEVLNASGPGARVRVLRAAYHSSAGPGTPAASFMLHSSRRVISSGFNVLESPTTPTKPLEISSMPLESSPEPNTDVENYKVTEPDDYEISEPSKWRSLKGGSTIRLPSEESSSADNASIIDLDSRTGRNLHRKYSYDSESSDIQFGKRNTTRASPLLDPPVTLSTLKYKSLLNSSNEWNTRRKSYSFEDTSPLSQSILHRNDTLAMESSTDSGICKSTEIVNDHLDDNTHSKYFTQNERKTNNNDESFKDWLSRNRPASHYKATKFKTYREHDIVLEDPIEDNVTLQASGKVSITLPVVVNSDVDTCKKSHMFEEGERKVKKVEFCKTEVHFAADSGKVNIIATDEKPPPSSDFRKRRSAFVPMRDMIDRPITLFGEKSNQISMSSGISSSFNNFSNGEFGEPDENTAATKSILKNKIPKPKPYLLGENMGIGLSDDITNKDNYNNDSVPTAVSLVNKQLETEKQYDTEVKSIFLHDEDSESFKNNVFRTISKGPSQYDPIKQEQHVLVNMKTVKCTQDSIDKKDMNYGKNKFNALQGSPVQGSPKTRRLKESDLTYFGIEEDRKRIDEDKIKYFENKYSSRDSVVEDIFHSVKLIQQVSNSVCNSEVESEDSPEYQNIPLNTNYAPIPTPRIRSKYDNKLNEFGEVKVLKPIIEKDIVQTKESLKASTRRSKLRRQEEITNRSLSAPPKSSRNSILEKPHRREDRSPRSSKYESKENTSVDVKKTPNINRKSILDDENPIYVNLSEKSNEASDIISPKSPERKSQKIDMTKIKNERKTSTPISDHNSNHRIKSQRHIDSRNENNLQKKNSLQKHSPSRRVEKSDHRQRKTSDELQNAHKARESKCTVEEKSPYIKRDEHRSRSSHRHKNAAEKVTAGNTNQDLCGNDSKNNFKGDNDENKCHNRKLNKDKGHSRSDAVKSSQDIISNPTTRSSAATQLKNNEKMAHSKPNGQRSNKRSEYVINYDDKNGTVSSVTKVRSGHGSPNRRKTSKEVLKVTPKENTLKNKTINKIALRNAARRSSRGSEWSELRG